MKYLFRGKILDCDRWVFGYLADRNIINDIDTSRYYKVDENTIGLWSGYYDDFNMRIFENDILKNTRDIEYYTIKISRGKFVCVDQNGFEWDIKAILGTAYVKVIGNTYEAE